MRAAAPHALDPILAIVERIDRRRRRLWRVRPGALLWVEERRHRGRRVRLSDGTDVRPGDAAWVIHFDNRRLRELATDAWLTEAYLVAATDLRALAARHAQLPMARRPVAYTGVTLLTPLTRRAGFEVHDRRRGPRSRLEDWYLRSLLVRWAPEGRRRLARGRRPLIARECWLSGTELLRRYAPGPASAGQ